MADDLVARVPLPLTARDCPRAPSPRLMGMAERWRGVGNEGAR